MSTQAPRRQQRTGGRQVLILLGVLLVVLLGILAIYLVSQASSSTSHSVQIVVTTHCITADTRMTPANIKADFRTKQVAPNQVPANAYIFTSENALDAVFMQDGQPTYYARESVSPGHVLLNHDELFAPSGSTGPGVISLNCR